MTGKGSFLKGFVSITLKSVFVILSTINCTSESSTDRNEPCQITPPFNLLLLSSAEKTISHNMGTDCLTGCHDGTGAQQKWAAAGTMSSGAGSSTFAEGGSTISNVGGSTLTVDECGNFYSTSLAGSIASTFPHSNSSANSMGPTVPQASCNQSGCHDGTATTITVGTGGHGLRIY